MNVKVVRMDRMAYLLANLDGYWEQIGRMVLPEGAPTEFFFSNWSTPVEITNITIETGKDAAVAAFAGLTYNFTVTGDIRNFPVNDTDWMVEFKVTDPNYSITNANKFAISFDGFMLLFPTAQQLWRVQVRDTAAPDNGLYGNIPSEIHAMLGTTGMYMRYIRHGANQSAWVSADGVNYTLVCERTQMGTEPGGIFMQNSGAFRYEDFTIVLVGNSVLTAPTTAAQYQKIFSPATAFTINLASATVAAQRLKNQLEATGPATITVTGVVDLLLIGGATVSSAKTIVGADATSTISGGLTVKANDGNTIILGVNFTGGTLAIINATDVDISHCTFSDAPVAVNGDSDNIAFSWNKFTATPADMQGNGSAMRIDNAGANIGILLTANYFAEDLKTDIPAVTNSYVVMCNNYIATTGNVMATIAGEGAQILSEHNIYQGTNNPLVKRGTGKLCVLNNFANATTGLLDPGVDIVFVPAYSRLIYPAGTIAPFDAASVATLITENAGNTDGQNSPTPATTPNASADIIGTVTAANTTASITASSVAAGDSFTLIATAINFTPTAHQWYLDNFIIPSATASIYTIDNATAAAAGAYTVAMATPASEIVTSAAFIVPVEAPVPPNIAASPVTHTINASDGSSNGSGGGGAPSLPFFALLVLLSALRIIKTREN